MAREKMLIDFTPIRGDYIASVVFTVLKHYGKKCPKLGIATKILVEAYKQYDRAETEQITNAIDFWNTAKAFVKRYEVESRDDIVNAVKLSSVTEDSKLFVPGLKTFTLDIDNKIEAELKETLEAVRYRDRADMVTAMVYQYFAHGNDELYKEFSVNRLMSWLKDEYKGRKISDTCKFGTVVDMITAAARDIMEENRESKQPPASSMDLRAFAGVKLRT